MGVGEDVLPISFDIERMTGCMLKCMDEVKVQLVRSMKEEELYSSCTVAADTCTGDCGGEEVDVDVEEEVDVDVEEENIDPDLDLLSSEHRDVLTPLRQVYRDIQVMAMNRSKGKRKRKLNKRARRESLSEAARKRSKHKKRIGLKRAKSAPQVHHFTPVRVEEEELKTPSKRKLMPRQRTTPSFADLDKCLNPELHTGEITNISIFIDIEDVEPSRKRRKVDM